MANKRIEIAVILTAVDKMTAVINKANKNAKSAFSTGRTSAITGAAFAAPLIYATNKAIEFEDKMADVAKVYGTKIGDSAFLSLGEDSKKLGEYLSKSAEEASSLMASLGQGGVSKVDLNNVSKTAGQMAIAFDLTADIAGDRYTKLKNALNSSWDETKKVGDAINFLSDKQASKASEILDFMASGGAGVARSSRTAGKDLAAMGSYLISVGKSGAESSTIIERLYKGIMKGSSTRSLFMKSGQGAQGFLAVLQKGANIKDPGKRFEYFKQFGEYGTEIMAMAGNMNQLRGSIASVANETNFLNSIQREFENRSSTSKFKLGQSMAKFSNAVIDFGTHGLPVLIELLNTVNPIIKSVSDFMKNNKELTGTLFKVVGGAAAFSFAVSGLSFALGGVFKTFSGGAKVYKYFFTGLDGTKVTKFAVHFEKFSNVIGKSINVVKVMTSAMWRFAISLLANPIVLIVAAVIALGAALVYAYYKSEKFRAVCDGLFEVAKMLIKVFSSLGEIIAGIFTADWDRMTKGLSDFGNIHKKIFDGGLQKSFKVGYDASIKASAIAKSTNPERNVSSIKSNSQTVISPNIYLAPGTSRGDAGVISKSITTEFQKLLKGHEANKTRVAY